MFDLVRQLCELVPGDPPPAIEPASAEGIPQPYRSLLVHQNDMTSTLTAHHREPIALEELGRAVTPTWLARRSLLRVARTGRPVEYGLIRIHLLVLEETVRAGVLDGRLPLGGLLNASGMTYKSCPGGFFRVAAVGTIATALEIKEPTGLFGRCNCLSDRLGRPIADVVEILPPDPAAPRAPAEWKIDPACRRAIDAGQPCCGRLEPFPKRN